MARADNNGLSLVQFHEIGRKPSLFAIAIVVMIAAIGCGNTVTEAPVEPSDRPLSESLAQADEFYGQRADLTKVRQGIIVLRQAMAGNQGSYDVAWRLAKFNYYLGAHSQDAAEQEKAYRAGTDAGKLAVKLDESKPEGHFWLGANYGGNAEINTLAGLAEMEDIKREMEAVIKINEAYESGSAYMALGEVYLKAPRLLGGDVSKAIDYLEKGVKIGPNNGLMRVRLAEAYAEARRNEDARRQIETLLAMPATPGYEAEHNEAMTDARKLQAKIK
jgi:hypothetical protein